MRVMQSAASLRSRKRWHAVRVNCPFEKHATLRHHSGAMETALPKIYDKQPVALELPAGDHWWCACGLSGHQPSCDGSHKGTGLGPKKFTLTEPKKVWLCNCKHSKNPPFCDGSHKAL
jgi:CDGSH iron-sulfur domain-containing protein 3